MLNKTMNKAASDDAKRVARIALEKRSVTLAQLHTNSNGLSTEEAANIRKKTGTNEIASSSQASKLHFLVEAFLTPFTLVLLILATMSLFTNYIFVPQREKDLSTVIIMVVMVLVSGITSFIQNVRTSNAVRSLLKMVSVTTNVRRDGKDQEIPTKDVVVGDIINVSAGDMVPADMKLLSSTDLFCSASSLNGESTPTEKNANFVPTPDKMENYLDYPNILFKGTTIVSGSGRGVVFATGEHTVFGKIAAQIADTEMKETTFVIRGLTHNISLLSDVCDNEHFRSGNITTKFLNNEYPDGFHGRQLNVNETHELLAATVFQHMKREEKAGSFLNGQETSDPAYPHSCDFYLSFGDTQYLVNGLYDGNTLKITINGETVIDFHSNWNGSSLLYEANINEKDVTFQTFGRVGQTYRLQHRGTIYDVGLKTVEQHELSQFMVEKPKEDASPYLYSPMPGTVISIACQVGDKVFEGQEVAVIEAMKLQNSLTISKSGTVKQIHVSPGQNLNEDDLILEIE